MRLPISNIRRIFAYAMAGGLGLGLCVYGFVRAVEAAGRPSEYALLLALLVGALLGLALVITAKLTLRQAAHDLHAYATELTDNDLPRPTRIAGDEVVYLRETLSQALAYIPRPEMLPQLAQDLAAAGDLQQALESLAYRLSTHVPARGALLLLLDSERELLAPAAMWGQAVLSRPTVLDLQETAIGRAFQERRQVTYAGAQVRDMLPMPVLAEGTSVLCLPLQVRTQPFGMLCLVLPSGEARLNDEQKQFVRSAADLFTLAAQGAMHHTLLVRESDRLASFEQLGAQLAASDRLDRALEQVLRAAARVTDSAHGSLLLLEPDESRIKFRITLKEGDVLPLSLTAGPILKHGLAGWALRERRADLIEDTERDTRWLPLPGLDSMRSAMVVPLLYGARALGILTLADSNPHHYSRRSLALAAALAAHAVTILAHMQHDEMVEPGTIALARRLFEGHLASNVFGELITDNATLSRLLTPQTRPVVVLYVGVNGIDRWHAQLTPAQLLADVITPFVLELSGVIHEHQGYVAHREDGLLAVFGYPYAYNDDRVRAVRAALAVQMAARRLRGRWRSQVGGDLTISVGMSQGDLTAGIIGNEPYHGLTLLGAPVREAQWLQRLARADEVLVGAPLATLMSGDTTVSLEPLTPLSFCEGEAPRPIYRLVAARP